MLTYLSTKTHRYTLRRFLQWQPHLEKRFFRAFYDDLTRVTRLPAGHFLFTDLERLDPFQLAVARGVYEQVAAAVGPARCLNAPGRAMRRRELLETLHEAGVNDFRVWPAAGPIDPDSLRFPVFVRSENEHDGALTGLLRDPEELERALLATCMRQGSPAESLLIVEFSDVRSADGLYRKYAAQRIGDAIFPYHVQFGEEWHVKSSSAATRATELEQDAYLAENPHREPLMRIFEHARIEYGRIDYGVRDGAIRVWEINTNGHLAERLKLYTRRQKRRHRPFTEHMARAFERMDQREDDGEIELDLSPATIRGWLERGSVTGQPARVVG